MTIKSAWAYNKANQIGDTVRLTFPDGKTLAGTIVKYLPGYYPISKENCYEVHGPGFVTICSARSFVK